MSLSNGLSALGSSCTDVHSQKRGRRLKLNGE